MADLAEISSPVIGDPGFDATALRARYRAERDKRIRDDGLDQYVEPAGQFAGYLDDPYVTPGPDRAPLHDEIDVVVVGGGLGGLLTGARLRQAGIEGLRFIEAGGDFGGTWYWNRYPGAACDVESYIYLPMLEELGTMPTRKYATAPEILGHCQAIARKFDLYRDACFQTRVDGLDWDETTHRWTISTNRGDRVRARFVVLVPGFLNRPKLPGIPGIEQFAGHAFHTSRWDYDYTGGSSAGSLTGLADKTVGIIGTGATAVQCIPHLAADARQLFVFQRTPSSIDVRDDRLTDPDWAASLTPGWQDRRMENFTRLTSGELVDEDLVRDGWTDMAANVMQVVQRKRAKGELVDDPEILMQLADFAKMEQLRARVDAAVHDKRTAEALKPYYNYFCKRPCFHDEYLSAFNRPNVTLVDTNGRGVERITERGAVVAGREYPLDCLIYGTGFEAGAPLPRRIGFDVRGQGGITLAEHWHDGTSTLHGFMTRGFPNLLVLSIVQSGLSFNFVHAMNEQARHIAYIVGRGIGEGLGVIEVTEQAEQAWVSDIEAAAPARADFLRECTPGYYNNEGQIGRLNARNSPYGGQMMHYVELLETWRAQGDMPGLEVSRI